jgi:hypothetical protein
VLSIERKKGKKDIVPIVRHRCPVENLPPVSTTPAELVAKFAAGVVDTGGAP